MVLNSKTSELPERDIFNLIKTNNFCKEYDRFAKNNINAIRLALYCATNTKPFFLNN